MSFIALESAHNLSVPNSLHGIQLGNRQADDRQISGKLRGVETRPLSFTDWGLDGTGVKLGNRSL
jgi:hypothetical protein